MITLFLFIAILAGVIYFNSHTCDTRFFTEKFKLSESSVVKKFNRILNRMKGDNINAVKEKLLETLEEYRAIKAAQFADNHTHLVEASQSVDQQINIIAKTVSVKSCEIRDAKARNKITEDEGARMMYDLEVHKDILEKLKGSKRSLDDKLALLDSKIAQFDSNLALRRAKIVSMIADAISLEDRSYIDLRLDTLEKEFKHETTKKESEQYVAEKMGDNTPVERLEFDAEKYKALYKEFE